MIFLNKNKGAISISKIYMHKTNIQHYQSRFWKAVTDMNPNLMSHHNFTFYNKIRRFISLKINYISILFSYPILSFFHNIQSTDVKNESYTFHVKCGEKCLFRAGVNLYQNFLTCTPHPPLLEV